MPKTKSRHQGYGGADFSAHHIEETKVYLTRIFKDRPANFDLRWGSIEERSFPWQDWGLWYATEQGWLRQGKPIRIEGRPYRRYFLTDAGRAALGLDPKSVNAKLTTAGHN